MPDEKSHYVKKQCINTQSRSHRQILFHGCFINCMVLHEDFMEISLILNVSICITFALLLSVMLVLWPSCCLNAFYGKCCLFSPPH